MLFNKTTFEKLQKRYDNMAPEDDRYIVSNCCGAYDKIWIGDEKYSDILICPECGRHCEWEEE